MRGGEQSTEETHGRRSRHSTRSAGKPRTRGKGGRGLTLAGSNSCLVPVNSGQPVVPSASRGGSEREGADKPSDNAGGGRPIPGEPGAGKLARRVRRRGWWRRPERTPRPAPILPHASSKPHPNIHAISRNVAMFALVTCVCRMYTRDVVGRGAHLDLPRWVAYCGHICHSTTNTNQLPSMTLRP